MMSYSIVFSQASFKSWTHLQATPQRKEIHYDLLREATDITLRHHQNLRAAGSDFTELLGHGFTTLRRGCRRSSVSEISRVSKIDKGK